MTYRDEMSLQFLKSIYIPVIIVRIFNNCLLIFKIIFEFCNLKKNDVISEWNLRVNLNRLLELLVH